MELNETDWVNIMTALCNVLHPVNEYQITDEDLDKVSEERVRRERLAGPVLSRNCRNREGMEIVSISHIGLNRRGIK